jgi:mannose-6-phosphate isomerase
MVHTDILGSSQCKNGKIKREVCSADIRSVEPKNISASQPTTGSQFFTKLRKRMKDGRHSRARQQLHNPAILRILSQHFPMTLRDPFIFAPIFMERVWGGRRLETLFGKNLPPDVPIGESWEVVDRPEAQSVVQTGPLAGKTLHDLWQEHRAEIFAGLPESERFPLLLKLLDAQEKLSVQVHPPEAIAAELGGEAKTEFWYVAEAGPGAEIFVGLRSGAERKQFEKAIQDGSVAELLHRVTAKTDDAMFLPGGRVHAIGGGNVMMEVQQNSDTTYRVFDWNRLGLDGAPRELHVGQSLRCIDFDDCEPPLIQAEGELLVRHPLFEVQKWRLDSARPATIEGEFAIIACLSGTFRCGEIQAKPGDFLLIPSSLREPLVDPLSADASLLRVTIPQLSG